MQSTLLEKLLSFDNQFNKRQATFDPLFKFQPLYKEKDRKLLTDEERNRPALFLSDREDVAYVLNPFFLSLLESHSIWFAPASQFNDPWDAGGAVSILKSNTEIESSVLRLFFPAEELESLSALTDHEKYARLEADLRDTFGLLRFSCFSQRYDSNPMWAHYADNHRGVCLGFVFMRRIDAITSAVDSPFNGYYAVRYDTHFAQVKDINTIGSAIEVLFTKHPDWAYEREVRFIKLGDAKFPGKGGTIEFNKASLRTVILGCKVPPAMGRFMRRLLDSFGYEHAELWRANFDFTTQSLTYQQFDPSVRRQPSLATGAGESAGVVP